MRDEEEAFIDRWSRILASEGLPPVAGRLWAWLLVCEPPEQSVEQIAHAIGASRGAISGAVRMLEPSGLIVRIRRRGDRREYWRTSQDAVIHSLQAKERATRPSLQALDDVIGALSDRSDESLARLREAQRLYQMLLRMFPDLIDQFRAERAPHRADLAPDRAERAPHRAEPAPLAPLGVLAGKE
jgi:DNA-binding transcriptional regulator GbsR (MarR family)